MEKLDGFWRSTHTYIHAYTQFKTFKCGLNAHFTEKERNANKKKSDQKVMAHGK